MGFHFNRVLAYLLEIMSVTPSWWLLSCLHDHMMVSPKFSFFLCSCPSGFCDSQRWLDSSCSFHGLPVLFFRSERVFSNHRIPLTSVILVSGDLILGWRRPLDFGHRPSQSHLHGLLHSFYQVKLITLLSFP